MTPDHPHAPRGTLDATVRLLRTRIAQVRARPGSVNEENTKRVLITPLLEALGWDVLDLDEVQNEYRTKPQDNPVDYAMFLRRSPCLFFEAKALGQSMADRRWIGQNIGYASVAGVHWCVLTNGDEYRLYNAHAPVDADEKLFRAVRVSDEAQHDLAVETLQLLSKGQMQDKQIDALWEAHFVDRRVKKALDELIAGDDSLVRLIAKRAGGLSPTEVRQALARAEVRVAFPSAPRPSRTTGSRATESPALADEALDAKTPAGAPLGTSPRHPPVAAPRARDNGPASGMAVPRREGGERTITLADVVRAGLLRVPATSHATHKGRQLEARVVEDGGLEFAGRRFDSPSTAGAAAVERPTCNGWIFWRFRDPVDGQLRLIDELRTRLRDGGR